MRGKWYNDLRPPALARGFAVLSTSATLTGWLVRNALTTVSDSSAEIMSPS